MLLAHHQLYTQARQKKQALSEESFPQLWIIATFASQDLMAGFQETLGRGATLEGAIQELLALPDDFPLSGKVKEVLADYHLFHLNSQPLSEDQKKLLRRLSPAYLKWREETRMEGVLQGVLQGIQEGIQQGAQRERRQVTEQLLKTRFGGLDEALSQVLNKVLQMPPEESLPLLLQLSREELVVKFG